MPSSYFGLTNSASYTPAFAATKVYKGLPVPGSVPPPAKGEIWPRGSKAAAG